MTMHKGNAAIANHSANGNSLLLFKTTKRVFGLKTSWSTKAILLSKRRTEKATSGTPLFSGSVQ